MLLIPIVALGLHLGGHSAADVPMVKSAYENYCMDLQDNKLVSGTPVNGRTCNQSPAQAWTINYDSITHANNLCLAVQNDSQSPDSAVQADRCSDAPGQVWLRDQAGFYNPHSKLCLSLATTPTSQLQIAPCRQPSVPSQEWLPSGTNRVSLQSLCTHTTGGDRIACVAEQQWSIWQTGSPSHETLLTQYTDGTPYEEWCADFVSAVYRLAGHPFTNGSADGWDENDANSIQDMGFTIHDPASYIPKAGDVAYFDYNGGHVEIVVRGGRTPTFVYGNSATIDPTTGNGQMQANTTMSDGDEGSLQYYLSPN